MDSVKLKFAGAKGIYVRSKCFSYFQSKAQMRSSDRKGQQQKQLNLWAEMPTSDNKLGIITVLTTWPPANYIFAMSELY